MPSGCVVESFSRSVLDTVLDWNFRLRPVLAPVIDAWPTIPTHGVTRSNSRLEGVQAAIHVM